MAALFARVSTFQGPADGIDLIAKEAVESILPVARQLTGYKGMLMLGDRESGKSIAVTLWESEAAMRESEEKANKLRGEAADAGGDEIVSVERFEVLLEERDS